MPSGINDGGTAMKHQEIIDRLIEISRVTNRLGGEINQTPARDVCTLARQVDVIARILMDVVDEMRKQDR